MIKKIFIDTETTGTDPVKNDIITMSGIIVINEEIKETFDYKIKPFDMESIDIKALDVNKIKVEDLVNFEDPRLVFKKFTSLLGKYVDQYNKKDKFLFYGFKSSFDSDMVRNFFLKNDSKFYGSYFHNPSIDVMQIANFYLTENNKRDQLDKFKLIDVANYFGINTKDKELHTSMDDIMITYDLYMKIKTYFKWGI